jgi:hypothetical protein
MSDKQWLERAKYTHNIHAVRSRDDPAWKMKDTSFFLGRSVGSVSEDLLLIRWWRIFPAELEKFDYAYDAIKYIRAWEREQETNEVK